MANVVFWFLIEVMVFGVLFVVELMVFEYEFNDICNWVAQTKGSFFGGLY